MSYLLSVKDVDFWITTFGVALVTIAIQCLNERNRAAIERAMALAGHGGHPIGCFEWCGKRDMDTFGRRLTIPERLWCYDDRYLKIFIASASAQPLWTGGKVLTRYVSPTLLWNDVVFAISLACLTVVLALGVMPLLPWQPWGARIGLAMAAFGMLYGIADVAEDCVLAAVFQKGAAVGHGEAAIANALTRLKLISITLSIFGALAFSGAERLTRIAVFRMAKGS
jgi:hypothetical protein